MSSIENSGSIPVDKIPGEAQAGAGSTSPKIATALNALREPERSPLLASERVHRVDAIQDPFQEGVAYVGERTLGSSLKFPEFLDLHGIDSYYAVVADMNIPSVKTLTPAEQADFPKAHLKVTTLLEKETNTIAYPTNKGMILLAAYYEKKYGILIKIVSSTQGLRQALTEPSPESWGIIIADRRGEGHVLPLLCHKPEDRPLQAAMLNSTQEYKIGSSNYTILPTLYRKIEWFMAEGNRQVDTYSCRTDALTILKDALRELKEKRDPDLEALFAPLGGEPVKRFSIPPSLAKTVQISSAVSGTFSQERYERLATFGENYQDLKGNLYGKRLFTKNINMYLNFKGKRNLLLVRRLLHDPKVIALAKRKYALYNFGDY